MSELNIRVSNSAFIKSPQLKYPQLAEAIKSLKVGQRLTFTRPEGDSKYSAASFCRNLANRSGMKVRINRGGGREMHVTREK